MNSAFNAYHNNDRNQSQDNFVWQNPSQLCQKGWEKILKAGDLHSCLDMQVRDCQILMKYWETPTESGRLNIPVYEYKTICILITYLF